MGKRVGLFGGSFNPPHNGHLLIAQEALSRLSLDEVWWIPANKPPHKKTNELANEQDRIEMVKRTICNNKHFSLSLIEFERQGISYTIDTVLSLKEKNPDTSFTFIMGGDMVHYLPSWHRIEELNQLVSFAGINRQDYPIGEYWEKYNVTPIEVPLFEVSSSLIRLRVKRKENLRYLLPDTVLDYIKGNKLYES